MADESSNIKSADIVVIGSGVAGALAAYELAKAGKNVLVLEAGPYIPRWQIVERYRNQPNKSDNMQCYPSHPWAPAPQYDPENNYFIFKGSHKFNSQYIRQVGGTTWHWAASAWRFMPNDFKLKSTYGVGRDWPISYDELEPYYQRAEEALGVWGNQDYGSPRKQPYPMEPLPLSYNEKTVMDVLNGAKPDYNVVVEPVARNSRPYDGRPTCCGNNNCMPICPIGAMYQGVTHVEKALQAGATLLANAVVFRLEVGQNKKIVAAYYKNEKGEEFKVEGKYFIVAANGIETPKLLLMSNQHSDFANGVANSSGMVGRNLMDHPGTSISFYAKEPLWPGRGPQEMTSCIGYRDGAFRATDAGKKLHLSNTNTIDGETAKIFDAGTFMDGTKLDAQIRDRASRFTQFNSFHEILPQPENRIVPSSNAKDAIGIPQPEITYSIDDYVKRSAAKTRAIYTEFANLLGGTDITYGDEFQPNNHITGTALMGADPKDSVLDGNCRSHDHDNLFIAGSAAMPTVGTVNVTLSLAALSIRITDVLKKEI